MLYPEQDRLANAQGCWNWFDTRSGRAFGEAALIMKAIDQVCLLYPVDRTRIAVAGPVGGRQHGGAAGDAAPRAVQGGGDAFGHPAGYRAFGPCRRWVRCTVTGGGARCSDRWRAASWPPLMVIHGGSTAWCPANGHAAVQAWADAAGARAARPRVAARQPLPDEVTDFKRRGSTVATLVEVAAGRTPGAVAPPSSLQRRQGPDASRMAWAFAAKQFRG